MSQPSRAVQAGHESSPPGGLRTAAPRWLAAGARTVGSWGVAGVWVAFAVVHAVLLWEAGRHTAALYGDPGLYRQWAEQALNHGVWPVLDVDWVYPVGALVPVMLPGLVSLDAETYRLLFMVLVIVVNALALGALLHAGRGSDGRARTLGAWWWLVFLLFLGPISLVRLDGFSAALTVIALTQLVPSARRPGGRVWLATAIATAAAWVKVAPGIVVLPLALTARRPWRRVVLPAAVVSVVVVGLTVLGGGGSRVLGFAGTQDSRNLQVESGAATPFSLARLWSHAYTVYYNAGLNVLEIKGPGTVGAGKLLDVLLVLAVVVVAVVTWRSAVRLRHDLPDETERRAPQLELVLLSTVALTLAVFVFDKVGSPQYVAWFAPPVAVALTAFHRSGTHQAGRRVWGGLAGGLLLVALLTHRLFPDHYDDFLAAHTYDVISEALRNLLVLVLAVGAVVALARHARRTSTGDVG